METHTTLPALLFHVAFADDWEACARFGEYGVATRGVPFDEVGAVLLCEYSDLSTVLQAHYRDVSEPLLLIAVSTRALADEGIECTLSPTPRALAELPMDSEVIAGTYALGSAHELPALDTFTSGQ